MKNLNRGVKGRTVTCPRIAGGKWVIRSVVGANVRIRRTYGGMSFLVPRSDVKFVRRTYTEADARIGDQMRQAGFGIIGPR